MASDTTLELSVIIPTYNRAKQLRRCLGALCHQTEPPTNFEVIVVVDGSTDRTSEMLAQLSTSYTLRVIEQHNRGQCRALNYGVAMAHGRYCLFLDDDIVADASLVAVHLRVQRVRKDIDGIGQITLSLPPGADWFARCFEQSWTNHYRALNRGDQPASWMDCYGGNLSLPRAAFIATGGFAVDLSRAYDVELAYRLERHGLSFVYIPSAVGDQNECKGVRELTIDAEKSGAAAVEIYRRHPPTLSRVLGAFCEVKLHETLLCRLLLGLKIPLPLLTVIGPLLVKRAWIFKWYRLLYTYCYWRGIRRTIGDSETWLRLTHGTVILMYHAFGVSTEPASRYVVPARRFARQMKWLKWMRYQLISMEEYLRYRREYSLPPPHSVVITIDDGYADNSSVAHPILHGYRFPATIFIVSNQIGGTYYSDVHSELDGRPMLSWSQIEALTRAGIEVGAHTRTHPDLTKIPLEQARDEIAGSKLDLERRLEIPIRVFSYPFGEYNAQVQTEAEQAGYIGSCSINTGLNTPITPIHALRRVEICGTDSLFDFALAVHFGERRQKLMRRLRSRATRLGNGYFRRKSGDLLEEKQPRVPLGQNNLRESETLDKGQ
jgi:glycosyltransferase involved in cell wall biosynthesis